MVKTKKVRRLKKNKMTRKKKMSEKEKKKEGKKGVKKSVNNGKGFNAKKVGGKYFFKDYPDFRPNLSPRDMFKLGSFGGKAAAVDFNILEKYCKKGSKALRLAKRSRKKHGYGTRKVRKVKI